MPLTRIGGSQLNSALTTNATDADLTSIANLSDNAIGLLRKTGKDTWTLDPTVYVGSVAGRTGSVVLTQNDIGNLTTSSSPTFSSVTANTFTGNLTGTIQTNAQPYITSVGNLTALTSDGIVHIANSSPSTNATSGALRINGGAGISGNLFVGNSISISKTQGNALQIDGGYGWKDLIGDITPRSIGGSAPTLRVFYDNIKEYSYSVNNSSDCRFHILHDYAPSTDIYLHVHWSHNGTNISGNMVIDYTITYAKGHKQASFHAPKTISMTTESLNITNSPQYIHRTDEIQISTPGGSSSMLNTNDLEVDGVILINFVTSTIPSITGSAISNTPYLFTIDIHYQTTGISTKNKSPNFYA